MTTQARSIAAAAMLAAFATPAVADTTEGVVLAYDRVARTIVLADKTVYSLREGTPSIPAELSAGDRVEIEYTSAGEDGIEKVDVISIIDDVE